MDMDESERIILSVMNKELRAIVWLGALLGAIIGTVNSLFWRFFVKNKQDFFQNTDIKQKND